MFNIEEILPSYRALYEAQEQVMNDRRGIILDTLRDQLVSATALEPTA